MRSIGTLPGRANLGRRNALVQLGAIALLTHASPLMLKIAWAEDSRGDTDDSEVVDCDDDTGKALSSTAVRAAVKRGDADPLSKILDTVRGKYRGQVVRVKLYRSDDSLVYKIRMIMADDRLMDICVEARSREG